MAAGLARAGYRGEVVRLPVADGGDGTVDAAVSAGYRRVELEVRGPTGRPVKAAFALLDDTAVIEAAQASGLALLAPGQLAPLTASTWGVGELILAAIRMGAKRIVLAVGGVATTDGGAGLLEALGARLTDASGNPAAARRRGARAAGHARPVGAAGPVRGGVPARVRREQPAARPVGRGGGLRSAEGGRAGRREAARSGPVDVGGRRGGGVRRGRPRRRGRRRGGRARLRRAAVLRRADAARHRGAAGDARVRRAAGRRAAGDHG